MRLIDANKIEFNTVRYPIGAPWPFNKEEQATMGEIEWTSKYQIENQPTVEAIPIEWIIHYKSIYGLTYSTLNNLLGTMLKDWEEENGTDRQEQTP